jgi:hypothetical protein
MFPDTVQIGLVADAKLTGRPEVAVALTANGKATIGWFGREAKAIVWLPLVI